MKKIHIYILIFAIAPVLGSAQNLYFPPTTGSVWDTLSPQALNWCPQRIDSLYTYLEANNTKAFIVLKDGKIVLEKYFGSHTQDSPWYWASAGKSLTAFTVGIAQQEGLLSLSDTTSSYLGQGWTSCSPEQEAKITIRHQLSMTSGLDDGVLDPYCTLDTCLIYKADAATRWAYHNGPYTLLDSVLEAATGMTLNAYVTQKIKTPTGMTGLYVPSGYNNVFYSTARSMARFGLLVLNKGNWNGTPILSDTTYFNEMTHASQTINAAYGYLWWLNGTQNFKVPGSQVLVPGSIAPNAPPDLIAAMGKNGQFVDVVPSQNLVLIRMGEAPDDVDVPFLLNDGIWGYMRTLPCSEPVGVYTLNKREDIRLYPNPTHESLWIESVQDVAKIEVLDVYGVVLYSVENPIKNVALDVRFLKPGVYGVRLELDGGEVVVRRVVKG